jgi:hypothetical protein
MEMVGGIVVILRLRQEKAAAAEELKARQSLVVSTVFRSSIDAPSSPSFTPLLPPPPDVMRIDCG